MNKSKLPDVRKVLFKKSFPPYARSTYRQKLTDAYLPSSIKYTHRSPFPSVRNMTAPPYPVSITGIRRFFIRSITSGDGWP